MRLRLGLVTFATLLFILGAVGLVGEWALATAVVVFVGTAVITAIVWEERDTDAGDLVPARVERP
jgi:hypothetical protein